MLSSVTNFSCFSSALPSELLAFGIEFLSLLSEIEESESQNVDDYKTSEEFRPSQSQNKAIKKSTKLQDQEKVSDISESQQDVLN
jgi:hypothetical protein